MKRAVAGLILMMFVACLGAHAVTYDVLIKNGRVIDGTGNPAYHADVGIKEGKIVAIGNLSGAAKVVIDAKGLVVAPGFIDVHTHAEGIEKLPLAENFTRMGVTTLVLGNCGSSMLNLGDYFRELEATNIAVNVASLIGHGTVRSQIMGGSFRRPPTPEELEKMKALVAQAMKDGAVGMSTGLIYLPGVFARTEEIVELAKVVSAYDGIYTSHMRDEGTEIQDSLEELFTIAREAHVRAEISHIKLAGKSSWGKTDTVLAAIEKARNEGLDITQDEYMYPASSTSTSTRIPDWAREGGEKAFAERLANPETKKKIVDEIKSSLSKSKQKGMDYIFIASYHHDPSLNGLNMVEAAKKTRGSDSLDDQIELLLDIQIHGGASAVFHSMSEEDLEHYLLNPNTMIASDSGVREYGQGVPHPRGYGNNARLLAHYVRELHLLRLEEAVRRMTSLPATTFRLKDRGLLQEGFWADITVFDPAKVQDNATFTDPHHYASGFAHVLVNGVEVVTQDVCQNTKPGKILRHTSDESKPGN